MPQAVTFDDVWGMFQETSRQFQETGRQLQETKLQFQETGRQLQETGRQIQETRLQFQETRLQFQEMVREDRERREETDRKFREMSAESDRKFREMSVDTDRKIKEFAIQVGKLGSRWGEFLEGFIAPACETLFAERGIPVHRVAQRVKALSLDDKRRMEIDLFVDNTDSVVLVEVKSRLTVEDVRNHVRRIGEFKEFFLANKAIRVMGAVAGIFMDNGVAALAMDQGLFVIVQSGENIKLANGLEFMPRSW